MELERDIFNTLKKWKNTKNKKALLVTGARQIGKTYVIRKFANANYQNVLEINFAVTPSAKIIFDGDIDANRIIQNLTAYANSPLIQKKTLIFFDEIQECPNARAAIKYLVEDGRFDYIESGSLLGVLYKEVPLLPVGYEQIVHMYPLTLKEFFCAIGVQKDTFNLLQECFEKQTPVPEPIHNRLIGFVRQYLAVGGMPAAVEAYARTNDLAQVLNIQQDIIELYRMDIAKYAANKPHVKQIFDSIPAQLGRVNKRFILRDVSPTARMERYASEFVWLADAGVALPCFKVRAPEASLALNEQSNLFKLFACDVGLLGGMLEESVQFELLVGDPGINHGSIIENLAAQELASKKIKLRYFDKSKFGEVDFLIPNKGECLPIEMKSGDDYKKHIALNNILAVKKWDIAHAYVLCKGNVEVEEKITYLPWYMLIFIGSKER